MDVSIPVGFKPSTRPLGSGRSAVGGLRKESNPPYGRVILEVSQWFPSSKTARTAGTCSMSCGWISGSGVVPSVGRTTIATSTRHAASA
jgi:hypothetical protein